MKQRWILGAAVLLAGVLGASQKAMAQQQNHSEPVAADVNHPAGTLSWSAQVFPTCNSGYLWGFGSFIFTYKNSAGVTTTDTLNDIGGAYIGGYCTGLPDGPSPASSTYNGTEPGGAKYELTIVFENGGRVQVTN